MNGVDYERWNPEKDPRIAHRYSAERPLGQGGVQGGAAAGAGLDAEPADVLCAAIGRLAHQKGYDILAQALPRCCGAGVQLALLGTGDAALEDGFAALAAQFPAASRCSSRFDDKLAHRIEAGADVFLMPSRFEPCGLNQMYCLRYGTLPLVHAVGGLADSIAGRAARLGVPLRR